MLPFAFLVGNLSKSVMVFLTNGIRQPESSTVRFVHPLAVGTRAQVSFKAAPHPPAGNHSGAKESLGVVGWQAFTLKRDCGERIGKTRPSMLNDSSIILDTLLKILHCGSLSDK